MSVRQLIILFFLSFLHLISYGQHIDYDTIVITHSEYSNLHFSFSDSLTFFEVVETDVDIEDGEIIKYKQGKDTIAIQFVDEDLETEYYRILLSNKNWKHVLLGRSCKHIATDIDSFPQLKISRTKSSNTLSFTEPKTVDAFIKHNYQKRLACVKASEDQFMVKYLKEYIRKIENDSISEFTASFTIPFYHLTSLFDLIVPIHAQDTVVCKIIHSTEENNVLSLYQTTTTLTQDSSKRITFTDEVEAKASDNKKTFVKEFMNAFEDYYTEEERSINEIRLNSMKDVDKSTIELDPDNEFIRYIRKMESFHLNSELKPKFSFYNYEIKKI
ncbi:MAG: hypothetical protein P1U56_22040 [Saprospiraceae bacterium]|nr:hypothetical protein [Saprospiraceae bacterium]